MLRHVPGRRRTPSLPAAVLAVTLTATLLGGCSGSEPASEPASQQESAPDQSQEKDERAADAKRSSGPLDPADAIATVSTQADGGSLDIHLMEAEVVGKLLRVQLWYQPGADYTTERYSVFDLKGRGTNFGVFLLDAVNLRKYRVVEADEALASDQVGVEGSAEQPLVTTHYFAAPPPDVETLTLTFENAPWPAIDFEVR